MPFFELKKSQDGVARAFLSWTMVLVLRNNHGGYLLRVLNDAGNTSSFFGETPQNSGTKNECLMRRATFGRTGMLEVSPAMNYCS